MIRVWFCEEYELCVQKMLNSCIITHIVIDIRVIFLWNCSLEFWDKLAVRLFKLVHSYGRIWYLTIDHLLWDCFLARIRVISHSRFWYKWPWGVRQFCTAGGLQHRVSSVLQPVIKATLIKKPLETHRGWSCHWRMSHTLCSVCGC